MEVKDLLAYLRVAFDRDKDGDGIRRCINAPFRFLGAKFVERVMALRADPNNRDAYWADVVAKATQQAGLQRRQVQSANEWVDLIGRIGEMDGGPYEVLDQVVRQTHYIEYIEKEEGAEDSVDSSHGANVRELLRVAQAFKTVGELLDYVDQNVLESARQKRGKRDNSLTLMSIHRSKGLEWPTVWVVGCNETIFPHPRGDQEEERRLMYVAATRARDHLVFSHVAELATRAGLKTVDRSHFLDGVAEPAPVEPDYPFVEPTDDQLINAAAVDPLVLDGAQSDPEQLGAGNPGSRLPAWLAPNENCCVECNELLSHCTCGADMVTASDRAG